MSEARPCGEGKNVCAWGRAVRVWGWGKGVKGKGAGGVGVVARVQMLCVWWGGAVGVGASFSMRGAHPPSVRPSCPSIKGDRK